MKIKYLSLFLLLGIGLQSAVLSQTNGNTSDKTVSKQSREIEIPADINAAQFDRNVGSKTAVLIQINNKKQIYLNDKLVTDATIRDIVKNPELSLIDSKSYKPVYVEADVNLKFEEVLKTVKDLVVELHINTASPPPSPDARQSVKFIVHKQQDAQIEKGNYVLSFNLPFPTKSPSLDLAVEIVKTDEFKFNNQTKTAGDLRSELSKVFRDRETNGVFYAGTYEVYRAVRLNVSPNTKYGDAIKTVNQIYDSGADWIIGGPKATTSSTTVKPALKPNIIGTTKRALVISDTFKTETINKNGIGSLSVPSNMIAEPISEKTTKNSEVEWTTYRYEWKTPVSKNDSKPSLKAEISTNIYNADFTKVLPDLPAEFATPELLTKMDYSAALKSKKQFGDRIKKVELLKLDGAEGSYSLFEFNGNIVAVWQTYRLIDGKGQMITITIEGDPGESLKAEQIIKSFKFSVK